MSLSPLAVAVQGLGYGTLALALQGFFPAQQDATEVATGGGIQSVAQTRQQAIVTPTHPPPASLAPATPDNPAIVGRNFSAQLFDAQGVDIPAIPGNPAGSAGSEETTGPDSGRLGRIADDSSSVPVSPKLWEDTQKHVKKQALPQADTAQAAINAVANKKEIDHGAQTAQAVQAAKERQQAPADTVTPDAASLRASREDEALAVIMILLESVA